MKKTDILRFCMITIAAVIMLGCSNDTQQGMLPDRCERSGKGSIICVPDFKDLAENPEGFDGKEVIVSGYLVIDRGALSLYSNDLNYKHMLFQDNVIIIRAPEARQREVFDSFSYSYVRVQGIFHKPINLPSRRYEMGYIVLTGAVTGLPDRSDPNKREQWRDVMIDANDISRR